jgi:post-segregation antitoxin (ccd killing protein)
VQYGGVALPAEQNLRGSATSLEHPHPAYYTAVIRQESASMSLPISIRLDDDVREELQEQARARGIGLATLLRDIATKAARDARRARIWQASKAIGHRVAASPEAKAFYGDIGTPTTNTG